MRIILFSVCLFAHSPVFAAFERQAQPAPLAGRGLAGCALRGIDFSLLNPASIASLAAPSAIVFYSPSPFELPQLSNGGAALAIPLPFGTVQAAVTTVGRDLYTEHCATVTYGVALDNAFSFGAAITYNALSIERYGSAHTFGIDVGVAVTPSPQLTLGASFLNANSPAIGAEQDELPRVFLVGMAYTITEFAALSADLVKDVRFPESVRVGIEANPVEFIALRIGISTAPSRFHAGTGISYKAVSFQYSIMTHQELGATHSIGLSLDL